MKSKQLPSHGRVRKLEMNVPLDATEQRRVIVLEQVGGYDHHAIEAIHLLHEDVPILVDRRGARFAR